MGAEYADILKATKRREARAAEKTAYGGNQRARMKMGSPIALLASLSLFLMGIKVLAVECDP